MEAVSKLKYVRQSPYKVRFVADLIRGKNVLDAGNMLSETNKKATRICSQKKEIFLKSNQPNKDCDIHATPLSRFKGN